LTSAQTKRAKLAGGAWHRPDFRQRAFTPYDYNGFPRLDTLKESEGITLNVLDADGTHAIIVAGQSSAVSLSSVIA
jgi:hypothetical protein